MRKPCQPIPWPSHKYPARSIQLPTFHRSLFQLTILPFIFSRIFFLSFLLHFIPTWFTVFSSWCLWDNHTQSRTFSGKRASCHVPWPVDVSKGQLQSVPLHFLTHLKYSNFLISAFPFFLPLIHHLVPNLILPCLLSHSPIIHFSATLPYEFCSILPLQTLCSNFQPKF